MIVWLALISCPYYSQSLPVPNSEFARIKLGVCLYQTSILPVAGVSCKKLVKEKQINLAFHSFIRTFAAGKQCFGLSLVP